jgi:hypothetical protein
MRFLLGVALAWTAMAVLAIGFEPRVLVDGVGAVALDWVAALWIAPIGAAGAGAACALIIRPGVASLLRPGRTILPGAVVGAIACAGSAGLVVWIGDDPLHLCAPALASGLVTCATLACWRRLDPLACPRCEFDLRHSPGLGPCPECGFAGNGSPNAGLQTSRPQT